MFQSTLMPTIRRRPVRNQQPRTRNKPASHGQKFLRLLIANWQPPNPAVAANIDHIARRLDDIPLPGGAELRVDQPDGSRVSVWWENTGTQHCIQLDIDLARMEADYEYSMVCEERDRLKPFPARPLGSVLTERIDMNLRQQAAWSWLAARIQATATPTPRQRGP